MTRTPDTIFTQAEYRAVCEALDEAMSVLLEKGASEEVAQTFLRDFVSNHYCKVWREIRPEPGSR